MNPFTGYLSNHPGVLWPGVCLALMMVATIPAYAQSPTSHDNFPRSLLGTPLRNPDWPPDTLAWLEKDLLIARAVMEIAPEREDSYIWLGRRFAYLNRFDEAIAVYTQGLEKFPDSYKLLRFRGRALARSRQFEAALTDYARGIVLVTAISDSYEPDGLLNVRNQFLGSWRGNLHYYWAQTSWAVGDYASTLQGMERSAAEPLVQNPDHQVATCYWRVLALRKLGRDSEAMTLLKNLPENPDLLENHAYYDGLRYMQGALSREQVLAKEEAISAFAVAMMDMFKGRQKAAAGLLDAIIMDNPQGFWPAETELLALRGKGLSTSPRSLIGQASMYQPENLERSE